MNICIITKNNQYYIASATPLLLFSGKSAKLHSEYADTALLFIFREKKPMHMIFMNLDLEKIYAFGGNKK
jgi:hypothetical protein